MAGCGEAGDDDFWKASPGGTNDKSYTELVPAMFLTLEDMGGNGPPGEVAGVLQGLGQGGAAGVDGRKTNLRARGGVWGPRRRLMRGRWERGRQLSGGSEVDSD